LGITSLNCLLPLEAPAAFCKMTLPPDRFHRVGHSGKSRKPSFGTSAIDRVIYSAITTLPTVYNSRTASLDGVPCRYSEWQRTISSFDNVSEKAFEVT